MENKTTSSTPEVKASTVETPSSKPKEASKKNVSKTILLVLVAILVLCVLTFVGIIAGLFIASRSNTNIPVFSDIVEKVELATNNDKQSAQQLKNDLIEKVKNLTFDNTNIPNTSYNYDATIDVNVTQDIGKSSVTSKNNITMKGSVNVTDKSNMKMSATVTGNFNYGDVITKVGFDTRLIQKNRDVSIYIKPTEVPSILTSALSASMPDIDTLKGKWLYVNTADLSKSLGIKSTEVTSVQDEQLKKTKDQLIKVLNEDAIWKNFKRENDLVLSNGVRTNCYSDTLDENGFEKLYESFSGTPISKALDINTTTHISVCTGRMDKKLYKLSLSYNQTSKTSVAANIEMNITENVYDYDKGAIVDEPAKEVDLVNFIQEQSVKKRQQDEQLYREYQNLYNDQIQY